jgi:hypothetical protein
MSGNPPAARPKIDLDRLDLSGLYAKAVALLECLRERGEPGLAIQDLQKLRDCARLAAASVCAEFTRLGFPGQLFAGDLEGEGRKCRAVETIYLVARTLQPEVSVWPGWAGYFRDLGAAIKLLPPLFTLPRTPGNDLAHSIRLSGAVWEIHYGTERGTYPASDYSALATVTKLLARPNQRVSLLDVVDADTRKLLERSGSRDDVLDDPAIAQLQRRYEELRRDMADQDDPLVKRENEKDLADIIAELRKGVGPRGRRRRLGRTPMDQAWDALTKNLHRLWPRLRQTGMPALADHLENAIHFNRPHIIYLSLSDTLLWDVQW